MVLVLGFWDFGRGDVREIKNVTLLGYLQYFYWPKRGGVGGFALRLFGKSLQILPILWVQAY